MTESEILETILRDGYVKSDVHRRLRILRQYLESTFFGSGDKQPLPGFLVASGVSGEDQQILMGWGGDFYGTFTKENAYDLVDSVGAKIKELPVVNLYIPIELEKEQVKHIGTWFRQNVDKNILVEFHLEHAAVGGCAFAWQGVYQDYSLRHYLHARNEDIQKIIDGYTTKE